MRNAAFLLLIFFWCSCSQYPKAPLVAAAKPGQEKDSLISIIAVGDMMLGSNYPNSGRLPGRNILEQLKDTLRDADITIGNLEGVIADSTTVTKKCKTGNNCHAFRMPPHFAAYFKDAGFDFLSIANNHSGDFGDEGILQTKKALEEQGIAFSGLKNDCEIALLRKGNLTLAFIGVGHGGRHVYINDYRKISSVIKEAKELAEIVVIFFHGGAEGVHAEAVLRKQETSFNESRGNVYEMAHHCIDEGADLVIGSGPHVTRGMEIYRDKLIAYSLGNFATYGNMSLHGPMGYAPLLKVYLNKKGHFVKGSVVPVIQKPGNTSHPATDSGRQAISKLQFLSARDFPSSVLNINNDGFLTIKNF
jgi:poly-gamma-glutamate capsule biosynthesis protein CapA/YwtB (metallophosphatase superfamily)